MWPFGCKHQFEILFVCTLADLGRPNFMVRHRRYQHDEWVNCNWNANWDDNERRNRFNRLSYPDDLQVHWEVCKHCKKHVFRLVGSHAGEERYFVVWDFLIPKIKELKRERDLKETERLQNFGNVNYQRLEELEKVEAQRMEEIAQLKNEIAQLKAQLADSRKNDGIWASIPRQEKVKLVKRYGHEHGVRMADVL